MALWNVDYRQLRILFVLSLFSAIDTPPRVAAVVARQSVSFLTHGPFPSNIDVFSLPYA